MKPILEHSWKLPWSESYIATTLKKVIGKEPKDNINDGLHIRNLSVKQAENVEHHTSWGLVQILCSKFSLNCCIDYLTVKNYVLLSLPHRHCPVTK